MTNYLLDNRFARIGRKVVRALADRDPYRKYCRLSRYTEFEVTFMGKPLQIIDGRSFYYSQREIFHREIYRFETDSRTPIIIDCGSNIGLSCIYFKTLYPDARITAIEADPEIVNTLSSNLENFDLLDIEIKNLAIGSGRGQVFFRPEGADSGRVVATKDQTDSELIEIESISLDDLISQPVDLLKIDIEGAETIALAACSKLSMVDRIFVEYHSFVDQKQTLHKLISVLAENDFRYSIHQQFASKQPLVKTETQLDMDLQLNIFAWRPGIDIN